MFSEPTLLDAFEEGNKALDRLKELGIGGALFEHQAAKTVQEQLNALAGVTGEKTKNLFLKARKIQDCAVVGVGVGVIVVGGDLMVLLNMRWTGVRRTSVALDSSSS